MSCICRAHTAVWQNGGFSAKFKLSSLIELLCKTEHLCFDFRHFAKLQTVVFKLMKDNTQKEYQEVKDKLLSELKGLTYRQAKRILDDLQLTIQLKSVVQ